MAQADRAGAAMNGVVASIRRVSQLVADIASAMQEQSTGVTQVGAAIAQLNQTTQQNAALMEETAAGKGPGDQRRAAPRRVLICLKQAVYGYAQTSPQA